MDISEESIIIIKHNKINYVNNAFLSKFRDIIMQYEAPSEEIELNSENILIDNEELEP